MALGNKLLDPNYRPQNVQDSNSKKSDIDFPYYAGKTIKCPVKFTDDMIEFIESSDFMDIELRPTQRKIVEDLFYEYNTDGTPKYREAVVISGMRCLKVGTEVMMFDGTIKNVEDIVIGDMLMGVDSSPRAVVSIHTGEDELYEISQSQAVSYTVTADHLISLKKAQSTKCEENERYANSPNYIDISVRDYLSKSNKWKYFYRGYKAGFIDFPEMDVELDPYFLGVWLGDGHSRGSRITTIDTEIYDWFFDFAERMGMKVTVGVKKETRALTLSIVNNKRNDKRDTRANTNIIMNQLRNYNVICNKHIPIQYIANSKDVRLQLLAGLLDTDAYYDNHCYEITLANKTLAYDTKRLCDTLGFTTNIREKRTTCKDYVGKAWRLSITGCGVKEIPVKILRKKYRGFNTSSNKEGNLSSIKVTPVGIGKFVGIEVDKDNKHLLSDGTVCHNSGKSAQASFVCAGMLQDMFKYDDPAAHFGQMPGYQLTAQFIATSEEQSKQTAYASFESLLLGNKWWKKYINYLQEREEADNKKLSLFRHLSHSIWFREKNLIVKSLHSNSNSLAGMTSFYVVFDELSRYRVSENEIQSESEASTAQAVYNTSQRSVASLSPYSRVMTVTSPMYETDYGMQLFYQAGTINVGEYKKEIDFLRRKHRPKNGTNSNIIAYHRSTFEFAPRVLNKAGIWTGVDPNDFITYKNTQPLAYKRDFLAIPPGAVNPYVEYPERVELCVVPKTQDFIFIDKIKEDIVVKDGMSEIRSYITKDVCINKADKNHRYFLCADQGEKSDSFVISMGHIEEYEETVANSFKYKILIDFVEAWVPSRADKVTVSFPNVSDTILAIANNFNIIQVAYDQWQSSESKQRLFAKGLKTVEMKASVEMYDEFKKLLYTGYVSLPENDDLMTEIRQLQLIGGKKVDHPLNGCFTGDTKVALWLEESKTFEELAELGKDHEFYVLASDEQGNVIPARAYNAHVTKEVMELCEVTFDDSTKEYCTRDHLFKLIDGSYKKAEDLCSTDKIMTMFTNDYAMVKSSIIFSVDKPVKVYDITVPKYENFALDSGVFVHNSKDLSDSVCRTVIACLRDYLDLASRGEALMPRGISLPTVKSIAESQQAYLNERAFGNTASLGYNASSVFSNSKQGTYVESNVQGIILRPKGKRR